MKTITLVAIIAAIVVVGGACVGIPLSGVLNDMSGTQGNDPVQPTDPPVEPTPTETPTPTPTSTPMSSFSGGGPKSDSGGSSTTPITPSEPTTPSESETSTVIDEQTVPNDGSIDVAPVVLAESVVSEMTMTFPLTYDGKVTFSKIPDTITLPNNALLAVDIDLNGELQGGVEITFTVPAASLPNGFDVNDACLYHHGASGWTTLSTTYVVSGTDIIYTAIADEFSPFALAFKEGWAVELTPTEPSTPPAEDDEEEPVECAHDGEWDVLPSTTEGMHKKLCLKCNEYEEEVACEYGSAYESLEDDYHKQTCSECGKDSVSQQCVPEDEFSNDASEKHWKDCKLCDDPVSTMEASCTFDLEGAYAQNNDATQSIHQKTCDVCKNTYDEACTADEGFQPIGDASHGGTCKLCDRVYNEVLCESSIPNFTSNENGVDHKKFCGSCNRELATENCIASQYNHAEGTTTHTPICGSCDQEMTEEVCSFVGDAIQNSDPNVETHTRSCVCGNEQTLDCVVTTYTHIDGDGIHTHSGLCDSDASGLSSGCGKTYTKPCTLVDDAETALRSCTECDYEATIVASIGEGEATVYYLSVTEAINAVEDGQVINLISDMTNPETLPGDKTAIINLCDKGAQLTYAKLEDIMILKTGWSETEGIKVVIEENAKIVKLSTVPEGDLLSVVGCIEDDGSLGIYKADGLRTFAKMVNDGNSFSGKTVKLMDDIDLESKAWTPIGNVNSYPSITFAGIFDGQKHTISNMVAGASGDGGVASAGLFGSITGKVKNVVIDNAVVTSTHYAGGIVGFSSANVGMEISECTVKNSVITSVPEQLSDGSYDNGDKAGGIIGYMVAGDTVTGNTVEKTTIKAYRDLGGIVGYAAGTVTDNTVNEVTLIVDKEHNYKNYQSDKEYDSGYVIGDDAGATKSGNTVDGTEDAVEETPGTVAELQAAFAKAADQATGDIIIKLTQNFDVAKGWTATQPAGYNGANNVIINGNGYTIYNLNEPLMVGAFGGSGTITINNLNIENAEIAHTSYNGMGVGAFAVYSDSSGKIILNDCKLINSKVECVDDNNEDTNEYAGGLIGYASSPVEINRCSVTGSTITSAKSAGAIIGQDAEAGMMKSITVTGCTVSAQYAGTVVGTSNAKASIYTDVTVSECTVNTNTAKTNDNYYGRCYEGLTIDDTVYADGTWTSA